MSLEDIKKTTQTKMDQSIAAFKNNLTKIRTGRANPAILDTIQVDYYGSNVPLSQVANVSLIDSRTISVQPWEKNMLAPIERAIMMANIGVTPQNDGVQIRLFMPPLTEERRKEFVKRAAGEGEQSKVAIRNIRRDAIEQIKKLQKDGLSEDAAKDAEKAIQEITDKFIALVEKHLAAKEKEMMAI
jgi:ribosome recycling factor